MLKNKFLTLLVALVTTILCANAQSVYVYTAGGNTLWANLIHVSDTAIVVERENTHYQFTLYPKDIKKLKLDNGDTYVSENGVFVFHSLKEDKAKERLAIQQAEAKRMGDPNYVIGKAMKTTGGLCLGVGVPMAFVGAILVGVGSKEVTENENMSEREIKDAADKAKTRANCKTAGLVLLPCGASLTITGIPLFVKGKQIMEMKVNYTGNGAGLAFAW